MEVFDPKSFSSDWEIMVYDRQERAVGTDKLLGFAGALRQELDLPIQIDWNTVECALGVNRSFGQIWDRIQKVTDRLTALLNEYSLDPCPAASHPREPMYNAAHVHVGTLRDESDGLRLEADMVQYVAAFAALAANSPVCPAGSGYKSNRVRFQANGCTRPSAIRTPEFAQPTWGMDAGPKLQGAATFEVRILDCASSRRFLAELATFVAAYVHHRSRRISGRPPSKESFERSMVNRWSATRHGLQATFLWDDGPVPVADLLSSMIDDSAESLSELGCRRSDLQLINTMLKKRTTQADHIIGLAKRYPDPYVLGSVMTKVLRHWDAFDGFLETAPTLDPTPAPNRAAILAEHLDGIGEGSHVYRSREAMNLPPPAADAIVEELVREGRIKVELTRDGGTLLTRVASDS